MFVTRDEFVEAITTNSKDTPAAEWVFKTDSISQNFHESEPLKEIEKEIEEKKLKSGEGEVAYDDALKSSNQNLLIQNNWCFYKNASSVQFF